MSRPSAVVLCLAVSSAALGGVPDYEVGVVEHRIVEGPDEDGDLLISIKVLVTNFADEDQQLSLEIQGCDGDGFEVFEEQLEGTVGARSSKSITDTFYIDAEVYASIAQWNIEG